MLQEEEEKGDEEGRAEPGVYRTDENLSSITSFLFSFQMNFCPARVCPSLVASVGLTDLPSALCVHPPISMVKSLQDVCLETSLLLEREAAGEGRGESLAQAKLEQSPRSPEGRVWVLWDRLFSMGRVLEELGCCRCWQVLLG